MYVDKDGITRFKNAAEIEAFLGETMAETRIAAREKLVQHLVDQGMTRGQAEDEADRRELENILEG